MHIQDIFARDSRTFSFEFFPPGTDSAWDALFERISDFEQLEPSFVSVTYGAGGSTRERTHDLVMRLHGETALDPIPHLTCVGHRCEEVQGILERYAEAGVSNLMALHGDPPASMPNYSRERDAFRYAIDLVKFIRRFNETDAPPPPPPDPDPDPDRGEPRGRGPEFRGRGRGFGIGVAGFPEGHPATPNTLTQMEHLKAKVDAGADYVCTQLFFDNHVFYDWRDRCELAGINVPLIAGIMPIASYKNMVRMAELAAGTRIPASLLRAIDRCKDDPDAAQRVGVHWATEQCRDLLDNGVRGIHFYTLNRSDATRQIYQTLGAKNSAALR